MTSSAIGTRIELAVIDVDFAVSSIEARQAIALVIIDEIDASAAILARINGTVINVVFTMGPSEASRANALVLVFIVRIHEASSSIFAGCSHPTMVNFDVTIHPSEARLATAFIP